MRTAHSFPALPAMVNSAAKGFARRYPLLTGLFADHQNSSLIVIAFGALVLYASVYAGVIMTSENLLTVHDAIIGGDFIVFWSAAQAAAEGNALAIYDPTIMENLLLENFPVRDSYKLYWQYPPTVFLIIAPLATLGYLPALWLWGASTGAILGAAMFSLWRNHSALLIAFASAVAFQALITGQTGFLTAALLAVAAGYADRRPVIAGIAAGLLTFKPQLGLLIPVAFMAAGCWRAFSAAAVTAIALAGVSLVFFGTEIWIEFFNAVTTQGGRMGLEGFPFHKIISPYGAAAMVGAPASVALALQGVVIALLGALVFMVWRHVKAWDLRLMALCAAAPLATPYAFYYELTIFLPPMLLVARAGLAAGWLRGEKFTLTALWMAPLFLPGARDGLPLSFLIAATAFFICARRPYLALMEHLRRRRKPPRPLKTPTRKYGGISSPRPAYPRQDNQARRPRARPG